MPDSRFTHANGVNLHYLDWRGSGPTVVCLHGVTGQCRTWDALAEALSPQYRVIALDLRGHGDSEKPAAGYATTDFAADLEGLAQTLGLSRFILVGHSLGARIAALYGGLYGQRLSHLVLEDPAFPLPVNQPGSANAVLEWENARPATFPTLEAAIEYVGGETDMGSPIPHRERWTAEETRKYVEDAMRQRADGAWEWKYSHRAVLEIIGAIGERGHADIMDNAKNIPCPTLLVRGAESTVCTPDRAAAIRSAVPNCQVVSIEDVGHGVHQEKFSEFLAAVKAFIA